LSEIFIFLQNFAKQNFLHADSQNNRVVETRK
jgi:hypothetical protein